MDKREEMEKLLFELIRRQHMQEVVRMMGGEFSCPICQGLLCMATLASCGHMFCQKCIRTWCVDYRRRNCPVCRVPIAARVRALQVDRFIRHCLEEAGDRETVREMAESVASATAEETCVYQIDRAPVRSTDAATFYGGTLPGTVASVRTTATTSASSSSRVASFGVSSD